MSFTDASLYMESLEIKLNNIHYKLYLVSVKKEKVNSQEWDIRNQ